jgi:hypothetical protein
LILSDHQQVAGSGRVQGFLQQQEYDSVCKMFAVIVHIQAEDATATGV